MRLSLLVAATFLVAPVALAGGAQDAAAVVEHIFEQADRDGDGSLTPAEFEGAGLGNYGVSFDDSDLNGDGEVSMAEYLEIYHRHHPPYDRRDA